MALLSIYLLGPFHATLQGKPVSFEYDKVRALLAYLVMELDRPVKREKLAALLWPEASQESAHGGLRQALSKLRHALDVSATGSPFLITQRDTIQFNPQAGAWVDAWAFTQALSDSSGHKHRHLQTCSTCAHLQKQACDLYRGDFLEWLSLPDSAPFEVWTTITRERMSRQAVRALQSLVAYAEHSGDYARQQSYAERQLELDPLSEEAHTSLIRALAATGQRTQAIAHYKRFSRLLADELGLGPSAEMVRLVESIRNGALDFLRENGPGVTDITLAGQPMPTTPLDGRSAELAELQAWLENPDRRLITVTGPGGIGKTRLALAVTLAQQAAFLHGAVFVNLAQFNVAGSFIPGVAEALHLSGGNLAALEEMLVEYMRHREILLVLDSFEYTLASRPALVRLLGQSPGLVVLVTSRVHLNLPEEWIFNLGGLEIPPVSNTYDVDEYSAVTLFLNSARRVRPDFVLAPPDKLWVAEICRLTRGMPLAIVLAAPWVRVLTCQEIAQEIHASLDILATSTRHLVERHSSVRAVFDQSWSMLKEEERRVFRRLSVFHGSFDRQVAQEIAGANLKNLVNLVDQSFLMHLYEGRYDCHDLLRQYAFEKLAEAGEVEQVIRSHFQYYLRQAEIKESQLESAEKLVAFAWFVKEQHNLQAALQAASQEGPAGDPVTAQRLKALLHHNWHHYGVHRFWQGSFSTPPK